MRSAGLRSSRGTGVLNRCLVGKQTTVSAFTSEQYAHPYPDGIQEHYWTFARNRIVARRLAEVLGSARDARVLDIGCGRGITVDYLRQRGFDAWGCEVASPLPITPAVAPYLHLETDAFTLDEAARGAVRTILLLDMLEHLEDPTAFLLECRSRFPACTSVLVTLPARMELWSNYDEYYGHFRRFDRASLEAMIPRDAFEIVRFNYFYRLLYAPARLLSALGRRRAIEVNAPEPGRRWMHHLIGRVFDLEERVLPARLAGTSLLAVLHVRR